MCDRKTPMKVNVGVCNTLFKYIYINIVCDRKTPVEVNVGVRKTLLK